MTRKMILIAGVAVAALAAPVAAQKEDRGGGRQLAQAQQGGGQKAERPQRQERQQVQRAERPQRVERQQVQRAERPQRVERQQVQRAERPQRVERQQIQRAERPQRVERQRVQRAERPQRAERQQMQRAERPQRVERQRVQRAERPQRVERQAQRQQVQRADRQTQRIERSQQRVERHAQRIERNNVRPAQFDRQQQRLQRRTAERLFAAPSRIANQDTVIRTARFDGSGYRPLAPVFSTREMRDMTPFRAKFDNVRYVSIGDRYDNEYNWSPVPSFYGSRYSDNDDYYYRYNNDLGYAYQIRRQNNLVSAFYPLFGGYGIGDPWPQTYYSSYVPAGYRDYYYDTPDYYYRNDGYGIYQVDAGSQLITALVSLVMGGGYGIGQALPASYSAYNVPLQYRANYYDTDDRSYRYGDGYIYQVDPYSRQIEERYPIYSDNYYVGQAWPVAYPDYNVPYGYRSAYADSPQYQYRYANGGIYQVDPTNQMIMALASLVTGDQFAVGQPMPVGYDIYNVPLDYRDRYADSDDEYYRYANGYVYEIDPDSGLIEDAHPIYA